MTDINTRGATADDWFQFDFVLGLGDNLLPAVPAGLDVRVLAGSTLEGKVGKIPSQFNRAGEAHGLKDWQKRPILSNEIQLWQADRRLNICIRLGQLSGVYAFDVDINDHRAMVVQGVIERVAGPLPLRFRADSQKILMMFRMEEKCPKRKIKLDRNPKGPAIELLGDGQQFVCAGSHSDGQRYQWAPGLPEEIPTLSMAQVNQIWETLTRAYATTDSAKANQIALAPDQSQSTQPNGTNGSNEKLSTISGEDWQQLLSALRYLLPHAADNDTWSEIGYALLNLKKTPVEGVGGYQLWLDFSKKAPGYEAGGPEAWWETHRTQKTRTDYRHIINMARQRGMERFAPTEAFPPVQGGEHETESDAGGSDGHGVESASGSGADAPSLVSDAPIKPIIRLAATRYAEIVDQLEGILVPYAYVQGPHLVRVTEAKTEEGIERDEDMVMLTHISKEWLKYKFSSLVDWQKMGLKGWYSTGPSVDHINTVLNLGSWTQLRKLDAIARAPFVRPDGSICDEPGYDRRARVLYVPSTRFPPIPESPDADSARAALGRLRDVYSEFPWKEPASESAFLSHILSEAARVAIDTCPMYFYDAPSAGTGKGLLQGMAARIVHGSKPALRAWVADGDEIRKALYAAVLAGDRSLWFDNLPDGHKTRSNELCAFLTTDTWTDRKLGESESLRVPNKCVVVASGNNITPTGDLARRSLVVRMDANTERLKERVFKIPLLAEYVMENRPQMLVDALTIIKAFNLAQNINTKYDRNDIYPVPLQSFERWSHFCRNPLIWLGLDDPVATQKETDDESKSVGNIYTALASQFGDREFSALDVARLVNGITDSSGELANLMMQNGCKEPNSPTKVGYWLRGFRDRISDGLKLVHAGENRRGILWKLTRMNEDLT